MNVSPVFALRGVSVEETLSELRKTDSSAAAGPDGLSGQLIRELAPSICSNIASIFNLSIKQGCFPSMWKRANITAIWKGKGSKEDPNNFRPISILPIIARVFERMVAAQMYTHCDQNRIIPEQQFGFRKKSNCEVALLKASDSWLSQVDAGLYVGALLIDLSKAFDSVPHIKLLNELASIGCDSVTLKWFSSYLTGRFQSDSEWQRYPWMPIDQGVPQGSGLSPLLFNIYARNLQSSCNSPVVQFADDVTASESDKDITRVISRLTGTYDKVKNFCSNQGLTLNANKTQLIIFKTPSKRLPDDLEMLLDGHSIKPQAVVKLLGFNVDQHFTWGDHIDKVAKKCNGLIGALSKATPFLSHKLLRMAYLALIRSHLEYCSTLLMSASNTQLEKLEIVQRKAIRSILQLPRDSASAPLLDMLSLEPLGTRRINHALSTVKNILSSNCHPALADFFDLLPSGMVSVPCDSRLKLGTKRFRVIGANLYNNSLF